MQKCTRCTLYSVPCNNSYLIFVENPWLFLIKNKPKCKLLRYKIDGVFISRCKVCSSELIFNREDVTGHLKRAHTLTYGQYKSFFNGFSDVIISKPVLPSLRRWSHRNDTGAALEPQLLTPDSVIPVCQYACKECELVFNRRQLIKHILKVLHMNLIGLRLNF